MRVLASQGDTVDTLCWRHLGSSAAVEQVLDTNQGIPALGPVLPTGTPVELPDSPPVANKKQLIQLWD